jgi:hypothetical protein
MGLARIYGNAASAYLALECTDKARTYAQLAVPHFAEAGTSAASHALTLADEAVSHLLTPATSSPEEAGRLMQEAFEIGSALESTIVADRVAKFIEEAQPWANVPEIEAVSGELEGWLRRRTPLA